MLNVDGEMIGINVAVRVGAQGIGFAIPVDTAMQVAADLIADDAVNGTWAGITGTSRRRGDQWEYVVRRVQPGPQPPRLASSPAT